MFSSVIFVALALLWAVFLIPKALRSHDEAAVPRSVESTSGQARVLTRRDAAPVPAGGDEPAAGPADESGRAPEPVGIPEQRRPSARTLAERQRRLAASAARRRRRVLGVLLLVTAVVGLLSVTGVLLPWAPTVPVAAVLGFLVVARVTVRRERRRWDALRAAAGEPGASQQTVDDHEAPEVEAPVVEAPATWQGGPVLVPVARNEQGVAVVSDVEDTSAFSVEALAEAVGASTVPAPSTLWDPLPVTLPTYVGKPRATRSVRTIDLAAPGVSSSGRSAADSALVAESATATLDDRDLPGRRAVGD